MEYMSYILTWDVIVPTRRVDEGASESAVTKDLAPPSQYPHTLSFMKLRTLLALCVRYCPPLPIR